MIQKAVKGLRTGQTRHDGGKCEMRMRSPPSMSLTSLLIQPLLHALITHQVAKEGQSPSLSTKGAVERKSQMGEPTTKLAVQIF